MLANTFPSWYARKKGFKEAFIPWMGENEIAVLDFGNGKTIRSVRY
jgi:hypothetical protein